MKRFLSIFLCLAVLMSMAFAFSATAFADSIPDQNVTAKVKYWHPEKKDYSTIDVTLASLEQFIEKNCDEADNSNRTITIDLNGHTWVPKDEVYLDDGNYTVHVKNGTIDGNSSTRIFWIEDAETEIYLDGVTIQNAYSDDGGAIYVNDDTCWIHGANGAKIVDCQSTNCGGAIRLSYAADGTVIEFITFKNNSAEDDGGAIFNNGDAVRIDQCNFYDNTAEDAGGAIYCWDDTSILNCDFKGNTCGYSEGKDIYRYSSGIDVVVNGCTFASNGTVNFPLSSGTGSYGASVLSSGSLMIVIVILALALVAVTFFAVFKKNNVKQG